MIKPRLVLAEELERSVTKLRLLKRRERTLATLEHAFPTVPVFRRGLVGAAGQTVQPGPCLTGQYRK